MKFGPNNSPDSCGEKNGLSAKVNLSMTGGAPDDIKATDLSVVKINAMFRSSKG